MTRSRILTAIAALSFVTSSWADAPATMRFDYFHSGNQSTEMFSVDQLVIEALPWSGNMNQPVDKTLRGKYLFEIIDSATGEIRWSRSFSSIYGEWETTSEALFEKSGQKGVVGAFEGGNYAAEGYYRSEQNCLMFTRTEHFCAVCAEAIGKVIDEYTEAR